MATLSLPTNTPATDGAVIGCTTDDTTGTAYAMARDDRQWYFEVSANPLVTQAMIDADKATIIAQDITASELVWAGTDTDLATIQATVDGLAESAGPFYVGWVQDASAVNPVISNVQHAPTTDGAVITWITDIAADSRIDWGLTTSYGSVETQSGERTSHSITLTGGTADTPYNYKATSTTTEGGSAESANAMFDTLAGGPEYGPNIVVNGDFDANVSSWTAIDDINTTLTWVSTGDGGGEMYIDAGVQNAVVQTISVEVGKEYRIEATGRVGTSATQSVRLVGTGNYTVEAETNVISSQTNEDMSVVYTPEQSTDFRIYPRVLANSSGYFDNIKMRAISGHNLVKNGEFETNVDKWVAATGATITWQSTGDGSGEIFVQGGPTTYGCTQEVAMEAGKTYRLEAWGRGALAGSSLVVRITTSTGFAALVETNAVTGQGASNELMTVDYACSTSAIYRVFLRTDQNDSGYYDDISLTEVAP